LVQWHGLRNNVERKPEGNEQLGRVGIVHAGMKAEQEAALEHCRNRLRKQYVSGIGIGSRMEHHEIVFAILPTSRRGDEILLIMRLFFAEVKRIIFNETINIKHRADIPKKEPTQYSIPTRIVDVLHNVQHNTRVL
jgi:hypothetical protein